MDSSNFRFILDNSAISVIEYDDLKVLADKNIPIYLSPYVIVELYVHLEKKFDKFQKIFRRITQVEILPDPFYLFAQETNQPVKKSLEDEQELLPKLIELVVESKSFEDMKKKTILTSSGEVNIGDLVKQVQEDRVKRSEAWIRRVRTTIDKYKDFLKDKKKNTEEKILQITGDSYRSQRAQIIRDGIHQDNEQLTEILFRRLVASFVYYAYSVVYFHNHPGKEICWNDYGDWMIFSSLNVLQNDILVIDDKNSIKVIEAFNSALSSFAKSHEVIIVLRFVKPNEIAMIAQELKTNEPR